MELKNYCQKGMKAEQEFFVEDQFTAEHVGSGTLRVLATPSMIGFMERVARDLIDKDLQEGYSSVGISVNVRHLAATPVGELVRVTCAVDEVEGRRVEFHVEAWDEVEQIGEGSHQRFVIDIAKFLDRVEEKRLKLKS